MECRPKSLSNVLEVFNTSLNEEQAWAVCFQCAKYFEQEWNSDPGKCYVFDGIESVVVNKDGSIGRNAGAVSEPAGSEHDLVESLGLVIYQALDYGLDEAEEHKLSPTLEGLIERMTESSGQGEGDADGNSAEGAAGNSQADEGDEGIENDVEEEEQGARKDSRLRIQDVIMICSLHLQNPAEAVTHYKAVLRAVFAEATELSTFLEKISAQQERLHTIGRDDADGDESGLENLKPADWARLWIHMMQELRQGVKLRKVDPCQQHSLEFELTPYEILMEDIRTRRYTLNKIMVDGKIPPSKRKDAHNIMLEFIRSRPPLHPATSRKLAASPQRESDPREKLMTAIRSEPKLRPTPGKLIDRSPNTDSLEGDPTPLRKVIKPNMMLFLSDEEDDLLSDDDDDEDDDGDEEKNRVKVSPLSPLTPLSPPTPSAFTKKRLVSQPSRGSPVTERRHSITICQTPTEDGVPPGTTPTDPTSRQPYANYKLHQPLFVARPRSLQSTLECLSLTIEEVMHIRSVLTKAELECLMVDPELHALVDKAKVCFTCKKTKFSLFGNWSTKCKFCQRYVCGNCVSKMQIPTDHFEHIPVYTLSPSPVAAGSDVFVFDVRRGSAPTSPTASRSPSLRILGNNTPTASTSSSSTTSHHRHNSGSHHSGSTSSLTPDAKHSSAASPASSTGDLATGAISRLKELARQGAALALNNDAPPPPPTSRPPLTRAQTVARNTAAAAGPTMSICRDCKMMIVGIIQASRSSLQSAPAEDRVFPDCPSRKVNRNFTLDLKPVYKK